MDEIQASSLTGEDRRTFLQRLISVSAAAPLAGALAASWPAAARATTLSSAQMVGQRVIFSYPGLTVPSALLDQIRAGEAAGVIFFGQNISSESQIASVIQQLRQAQQQSPIASPLLLMTD